MKRNVRTNKNQVKSFASPSASSWSHVRMLWSVWPQHPHMRCLLGGGEFTEVENLGGEVMIDCSTGWHKEVANVGGQDGRGHTMSFVSSEQNSQIFWNKYHWRASLKSLGRTSSEKSSIDGSEIMKYKFSSSPSQLFFTVTVPRFSELNWKWCKRFRYGTHFKRAQKLYPFKSQDNSFSILSSNQLSVVDSCWGFHNANYVV